MHQNVCLDKGMKIWENRRFYSLMWGEEEMEKPHTIWLDQERKKRRKQSTMRENGLSSQFLFEKVVSFEEE